MSLAQGVKLAGLQAQIDALRADLARLRTETIEATAEKRRPMLKLGKGQTNEDGRQPANLSD